MIFNCKKERHKIGECPVCGTSWKGRSFLYIYSKWVKQERKEISPKDLRAYIRRNHTLHNQSRLIEDTNTGEIICPDCQTRFNFQSNEKTK